MPGEVVVDSVGRSSGEPASIELAQRDADWVLVLRGELVASQIGSLWQSIGDAIGDATRPVSIIELSGVVSCDGAGVALVVWLQERAEAKKGVRVEGLSPQWQSLVDSVVHASPPAQPAEPEGWVTQLGHAASRVLRDARSQIEFVGETVLAFVWAVKNPRRVRWQDTLVIAEKVGVNAVPVVCLLGFLMGLIIAFQAAIPMKTMGLESMIPMIVGIAMVRELGPLMTAILLAGRSGSAFAAEIGTMKVTEEINALNTFGLDPTRFLVVPRVLAAIIMTPLLSVFATVMGVLGGYVVMAGMGYSMTFYNQQILQTVDYVDFLQGVFKAGVFALLVAAIGCLRGLSTQAGPGAVGDSTTRSVVAGIVLIILADGLLGVVFFYVGI